jgi:MoaA/NifB/PqqE/SkfB family radical SAM enzyme
MPLTAITPTHPAPTPPSAAATPAGALPELRRYRPRAGHPDWRRLLSEARDLAARFGPTLERPPSGLQRWRRRMAAHATALESYVINRRRARAGRGDLLPLYFIWTTLRQCNFRCTYCDDHRGQAYPDLPGEGTLDTAGGLALLRIMRTRAASVYFAGGEPTLRDDLPRLTRAARDLAYFPLTVNTNGSLVARRLAQPAWRTWLADTDIIVVSLDRLDLASCTTLWRHHDPEAVLRNLLLLRELSAAMDFKLMVNTVIQPGHLEDARDVLDLAGDLGITFCPVPMNVGPRIHPDLPGDPAYRAFGELVLRRIAQGQRVAGSARMNRRLLTSAPLDCKNTLKPHVDHDGHLYWPCKSSQNVPPVRINVLDFADVDALYAHACARIEPTRFHGPAANQCGAHCNWAQNYSSDAYAHGLKHPESLLRDAVDFVWR